MTPKRFKGRLVIIEEPRPPEMVGRFRIQEAGMVHQTPWGPVHDDELPLNLNSKPYTPAQIAEFARLKYINGEKTNRQ